MFSVGLDITSKCNFNCVYCMNGHRDRNIEMSLPFVISVLDEFVECGVQFIFVAGGEPILHSNFGDIINEINKRKIFFNIFTNGYYYEDYYPLISDKIFLTSVFVSIDGVTQDVYSLSRDGKGFRRAWESLEFFCGFGVRTNVQVLVSKANYVQVPEIIRKAFDLGASEIRLLGILGHDNMRLSMEQRDWVWEKTKHLSFVSYCSSFGLFHSCKSLLDLSSSIVAPNGNFYYCCDVIDGGLIGNIEREKFSILEMKAKKKTEFISDCRMKYFDSSVRSKLQSNCDFCLEKSRAI